MFFGRTVSAAAAAAVKRHLNVKQKSRFVQLCVQALMTDSQVSRRRSSLCHAILSSSFCL